MMIIITSLLGRYYREVLVIVYDYASIIELPDEDYSI